MSSPSALGPRPLVSVITPAYNMGSRLPACIESIRDQTYGVVEHIVVDGGSTDDTVEILKRSDVRWISEPDRGQSDAINKGLQMAAGNILGWLNADDELLPESLERVVGAFAQNDSVGLVYGDIEQVENGVARKVRPSPEFSLEKLWRGNVISQPGTFWTKWAQDRVGLIDEDYHLTMDYELWLRFAMERVPAMYVPEVLARFVVHEESKTGSQSALSFAEEEARALRKHGEVHGAAMAIDRWHWDVCVHRLRAMSADDPPSARREAVRALSRMRPVLDPVRLFLWLTAVSPAVSRAVAERRDRSRS